MNPISKGEAPASDEMLHALYQDSLPVMMTYAQELHTTDDRFLTVDLSAAGLQQLAPEHVASLCMAGKLALDFWPADESMVYRWAGAKEAPFTQQTLSLEPKHDSPLAWRQHRSCEHEDLLSSNDPPPNTMPLDDLAEKFISRIKNSMFEHRMQPPFAVYEATALRGLMKAINSTDPASVRSMIIPHTPLR